MATVMLDAGHGGWHNGASFEGRLEKDDTLNLVLAVGRILEQEGIDVLYTRTEDIYKSPAERAEEANASGADYFVSIHRNSSMNPGQYSGVETLVYNRYGRAVPLAENINRNLGEVGFINLGVNERPGLVVLNSTQMPSVLVEVGFINTPADNYLLDTKFEETARAIADGILETVNA